MRAARLVPAGLALAAAAAPALADPLQDQVLAGMKATNTADVAFIDTTRAEQTGSAAKEYVTRYDPREPEARRWQVVRVDGRPPTAKESAKLAKATAHEQVPSYARLARWFGAPATRVAQAPGSVTYRFARLPDGIVKIGSHDASADTVADAVVNTGGARPFVERIRFVSSTGFRMMLVAKVERYVFSASYATLADGRVFPSGHDVEMTGSLMGKAGSLKTRTRYTEVRSVR